VFGLSNYFTFRIFFFPGDDEVVKRRQTVKVPVETLTGRIDGPPIKSADGVVSRGCATFSKVLIGSERVLMVE
jgi:hypothetical protein